MKKTALLVIDVQNKTLGLIHKKKELINNINQLITYFHDQQQPVIFIKQTGAGDLSTKLLKNETDFVATKQLSDAFTSSEFKQIVKTVAFEQVVVVGLMSHACIQKTCQGALQKGYHVQLINDGHASVIPPLRNYWNQKLEKLGVALASTNEFMDKTASLS